MGVGLADVNGNVRQRLFERGHGERMVAVAVRQQNVLERDALALDERKQLFRLVTRVDERGALGFLVDEQVAIRLQRADNGGDDFHRKFPFLYCFFGASRSAESTISVNGPSLSDSTSM